MNDINTESITLVELVDALAKIGDTLAAGSLIFCEPRYVAYARMLSKAAEIMKIEDLDADSEFPKSVAWAAGVCHGIAVAESVTTQRMMDEVLRASAIDGRKKP